MEPVVQLRGAVTLLGRFPALAGIDLEVAAGEVVLLRGANGAGKTTLLRCLAGLVPLARGEARVLGHDLTDRRQARSLRPRVGLLGHATGLYDELTATDNVRFWGRAAGARPEDVDAALDACGLTGRVGSLLVARLSAGQRRRTALACLVARRPELWLLDDLVRRARAAGATIVLASHELDRAEALTERVVTIAGGTIAPASTASSEERILVP
jgi:ABC-2 type transport system ATP-binding protein